MFGVCSSALLEHFSLSIPQAWFDLAPTFFRVKRKKTEASTAFPVAASDVERQKSYPYSYLGIFGFPLSHIKRRTNDDRFPLSLWETWFCSSLGVPIPTVIRPPQQWYGPRNVFHDDTFGDHLQTCQTQSVSLQTHDWVVYKLSTLFGSVGHKVKIHKITPVSWRL